MNIQKEKDGHNGECDRLFYRTDLKKGQLAKVEMLTVLKSILLLDYVNYSIETVCCQAKITTSITVIFQKFRSGKDFRMLDT